MNGTKIKKYSFFFFMEKF